MKIIEPGHVYELAEVPPYEGHEDGAAFTGVQLLIFVRRRGADGRLLPRERQRPGLLTQELLRVAIDRVRYLNDEDPCVEDVEIVAKLRDVLRLFEARAARRTIEKMPMPETTPACPICHHILCAHDHPERLEHEVRR